MGIAWLDEAPPALEDVALRTGGPPLMAAGSEWPWCECCATPMLFRAQIPLALTTLVGFDDERLMLVFECHHRCSRTVRCDVGTVQLVSGALGPRDQPPPEGWDVVVESLGPHPAAVRRVAECLADEAEQGWFLQLPSLIVEAVPRSIALRAFDAVSELGGRVALRPSPPTLLSIVRGGRLVPYEEQGSGSDAQRTTLPPLGELAREGRSRMFGLVGASRPGHTSGPACTGCGRPGRSALRLLEHDSAGINLPAATALVCLPCDTGWVWRPPPVG